MEMHDAYAPPVESAQLTPSRRSFLVIRGDVWLIRIPPRLLLIQALAWVFGMPLLLLFLIGLVSEGASEAAMDTFILCWLVLSSICVFVGLGLAFTCQSRAEKRAVTFDFAQGVVVCRAHSPIPFSNVRALGTGGGGLFGVQRLELTTQDGRNLKLLTRFPQFGDFQKATATVAQRLGVPVVGRAAGNAPLGFDDNTASMVCYLPIEGLFLIYSALCLGTTGCPTQVRFAARQSLLLLGVSFCGIMGLVIPMAVVLAVASGEPSVPLMIGCGVLLFAFWVLIMATRIIACVKAYRGRAWVIPWLKPLTRRWVDELKRAETHSAAIV